MNFNFYFYISLEKKYYNITTLKHHENQQLKCNIKMNYEDLLQQKIIIWYKNEYQRHEKGLIHSTPNGGSRNIIEAKKLKNTGLMAGVADLTIKLPNSIFIDIELKTDTGILSKSQKEYQERMLKMNCNYYVIRSLDEFILKIKPIIDEYLK